MPKLSSKNGLSVYERPDFLKLTVVENLLIAPRINCITMIKLPVSRMLGIKNRIINVPIPPERIVESVESLPRTLEEAEVIPVAVKKKKSMLSSMFEQHARPQMIRKAVKFLLNVNYPFYSNVNFDMRKLDNLLGNFLDECEEEVDNISEPMEVEDVMIEDTERSE